MYGVIGPFEYFSINNWFGKYINDITINFYNEKRELVYCRTRKRLNEIKDIYKPKELGVIDILADENIWTKFEFGRLYFRTELFTIKHSFNVMCKNIKHMDTVVDFNWWGHSTFEMEK